MSAGPGRVAHQWLMGRGRHLANQRPPPPPALSADPAPPRAGGGVPAQRLPRLAPARRDAPALGGSELHGVRDAGLAAAFPAPLTPFLPSPYRGLAQRRTGRPAAQSGPLYCAFARAQCPPTVARAQCGCAGPRAVAGVSTWSRGKRATAADWLRGGGGANVAPAVSRRGPSRRCHGNGAHGVGCATVPVLHRERSLAFRGHELSTAELGGTGPSAGQNLCRPASN